MRKQKTMTEKIRRMIDGGYTNKAIIEELGCKPQAVYNIRYQVNKERGLGALGAPAPKPVEGIGTPPKKRKPRAKPVGTGITPTPMSPETRKQFAQELVAETLRHHPEFANKPPFAITMIEPEPTIFDKVRERFRNLMRALGAR